MSTEQTPPPSQHNWKPHHTQPVEVSLRQGEIVLRFSAGRWPASNTGLPGVLRKLLAAELEQLPELAQLRAAVEEVGRHPDCQTYMVACTLEQKVGAQSVDAGPRRKAEAAAAEARKKAVAAIARKLETLGDGQRSLHALAAEAAQALQHVLDQMARTQLVLDTTCAGVVAEELLGELLRAK